jgi:hypothetical protein
MRFIAQLCTPMQAKADNGDRSVLCRFRFSDFLSVVLPLMNELSDSASASTAQIAL